MSSATITPAGPTLQPVRLALLDYHSAIPFCDVEATSGKSYRFDFDHKRQAFIYETRNQEDVNDLFRSNRLYDLFIITAYVDAEQPGGASAEAPPAPVAAVIELQKANDELAGRIEALEADLVEARKPVAPSYPDLRARVAELEKEMAALREPTPQVEPPKVKRTK